MVEQEHQQVNASKAIPELVIVDALLSDHFIHAFFPAPAVPPLAPARPVSVGVSEARDDPDTEAGNICARARFGGGRPSPADPRNVVPEAGPEVAARVDGPEFVLVPPSIMSVLLYVRPLKLGDS